MISLVSTRPTNCPTRNIATIVDAARRGYEAGRHHRIVHQVLQHQRQQRHGSVQRDADQEHQQGAGDAVAVFQQVAVQKRAVGRGRGVDDKQIKAERGDRRLDPDFNGAEPIPVRCGRAASATPIAMLSAAKPKVERLAMGVARLVNENEDADGQDPNGRLMKNTQRQLQ